MKRSPRACRRALFTRETRETKVFKPNFDRVPRWRFNSPSITSVMENRSENRWRCARLHDFLPFRHSLSLSLSLSLPLSFSINATKSIRRVCITNVTRLLVSHLLIANWLTISQGFEQVERTRRVSSFFATNGLSALDIFYKLSQNAWKGRRGIPLIPSCELSKFPQLLPRRGRTTPILPAIILRFVV